MHLGIIPGLEGVRPDSRVTAIMTAMRLPVATLDAVQDVKLRP